MTLQTFIRWSTSKQGSYTLGACLVVSLLTGFLLFGSKSSARKRQDYRFMHCPKCGMETLYNAEYAGGPCIKCKQGRLTGTYESMADSRVGSLSSAGRIGVFLFVLALEIQVILYLWLTSSRAPGAQEPEPQVKSRCPLCKRKLGYPVSKIGTRGRCPGCKKEITLPGESITLRRS
jgi:hypothetical protein